MSQGLLEGRRENQQACSWERSHPEFSKPLLPTESSLQSRSRAASLGSACVFTLLGCSFTCFCLARSDELFSNYALCRSDTSGTCRVSGRWALMS